MDTHDVDLDGQANGSRARHQFHEAVRTNPKVLLHAHLEGSITEQTLQCLSKRNGVKLPFPPKQDVIARHCKAFGWEGFLNAFMAVSACFQREDDFMEIGDSHLFS